MLFYLTFQKVRVSVLQRNLCDLASRLSIVVPVFTLLDSFGSPNPLKTSFRLRRRSFDRILRS